MRQRIWRLCIIIIFVTNLFFAGGAGINPALAAPQAAPLSALSVTPEEVDPNANRGQFSSIGLDGEGAPHIAYYDSANGNLMMATRLSGIWYREEVDTVGVTGLTPSIAIDEDGLAHIAYYDDSNHDLRYAHQRTPDGWTYMTVDSVGDVGKNASLALDAFQVPHIAYWDLTNHTLKYAFFDGTTWQKTSVPSTTDLLGDSSILLALTSDNLPRIAYRKSAGQLPIGLGYASFDGTDWAVETAYASPSVGDRFSMALDASNNPHISFMMNEGGLRYIKKTAAWSAVESVVNNALVGSVNSLALDSSGRPRIVYFNGSTTPASMGYAYKDGTLWRLEKLVDYGSSPDLVFGANGDAHISYQNQNTLKQSYLALPPFPDLQVADVWLNGTTVYYQLYNASLGAAPAGYTMALSVNNVSKVSTMLITDSIPAGGRLERSFSYTYNCSPLGALIPIVVDADSGAVIAETTRSNNRLTESWRCKSTTKPIITAGPTVSGITQTSATITWVTNTETDSLVNYGRRVGFLNLSASNTTKVTSHSITLTGLTAGASYSYKVTSTDAGGQSVSSETAFFTILPAGGTVSPAVTRSITKDDGPGEIYTLKAAVPNATGLETVQFFLQLPGSPPPALQLIGTAFSGVAVGGGTVEFQAKFSPGKTTYTRAQLAGATIVTQVAIPGGSIENFENLLDAFNPLEPELTITAPNPDYILYISEDSVPWGTKLPVSAYAVGYKWECDWSGTDLQPACEDVMEPVEEVQFTLFRSGTTRVEFGIPVPGNIHNYSAEISAGGLSAGDYTLFASAQYDGQTKTISIPVHILKETATMTLARTVYRAVNGNTLRVSFTLTNASVVTPLEVDGAYDYVRGFQPIFDDAGDVRVKSSYTPATRINQVIIDIDQGSSERRTIAPGSSYQFSYEIVPVIYENDVQYAIGGVNVTSLIHNVDGTPRFRYFDVPGTMVIDDSATIPLASSAAKALKLDDYLLVTHPANLKFTTGETTAEPTWNTLLQRMAELAQLRQGALAYLDSQDAATLNRLLEPEYHTWADKLHPNYSKYAQGYVLLVGEDNIVPSNTKTGLLGGTVRMTDNPFAHTGGSGAPDLVLGRLPGNDIPQLIAPIVTSLKVLRGELINDRSYALGTSGTGDGIQAFQDSAESAKSSLQSLGVTVTMYHEEEKARTKSITIPFDDGDLLAAGDIDGDGDQELIIGDVSTDDIYVVYISDMGVSREKLFHYPENIQAGHGFAVGDVDGDLKDELVIADDIDRIFIYSCPVIPNPCNEANPPDMDFLIHPFDNWDKLALGNVDSDPGKELIIAHAGSVTMLNGDGLPAGTQFPMAFSPEDDLTVGRIWDSDTIVEIVLMDASLNEGRIYAVNGTMINQFPAVYSEGDFVIAADIDGDAGDAKPEEVWVLNSSGNSIQGYHTYGSKPQAYYIPQRVIEGDKIAALKLAGESRRAIWLVKRDDNTYQLDRDYPNYIQTLYRNHASGADYLYYRGHGSSTTWENVNSGMYPVPDYGTAAPLAYGSTCSSGDYSPVASTSISERMLWWGAGAFIGATEVSYGSFNLNAAEWYSNHFKDQGPFARLLLKYKNKKWDDGTNYSNSDWPYWVHEYNFYGDAKFGFIGDTTQLPYPDAAPRMAESTTLHVDVPAYTVTEMDGFDYVDIPGGDVTTEVGQPRIPYYVVTQEYPQGTRVSSVTLTARGGKTTASGLNLPDYELVIDGTGEVVNPGASAALTLPAAPDGINWTPGLDEVFSWLVNEQADGSSQLVIRLNPFYYSPATTNVEYYTSYDFSIETTTPKQEITSLRTNQGAYRLNQPVVVEAQIRNNSSNPVDLLVSATLYRASGKAAAGADMRVLSGLAGDSAAGYGVTFDTNGLTAGSYHVEMEVRDTGGAVIDTETVELELGLLSAQADLTAAPALIKTGDPVSINLAVSNNGDLTLSGAVAEVVVFDLSGVVVASFSQPLADLAAGAGSNVPFTWDTTGAADWRYTLEGRVLYDSRATPVDSATVDTKVRIYLPVTMK